MDHYLSYQIDQIVNLVSELCLKDGWRYGPSLVLNRLWPIFFRWGFHNECPVNPEGWQEMTERIRAICTKKKQEVAGDRECQLLLQRVFLDIELTMRELVQKHVELQRSWQLKGRMLDGDSSLLTTLSMGAYLWREDWFFREEERHLNRLVDEYEREKIVEERKKEKRREEIELSHGVARASREHQPTSCDRRFSHDIPPDLPSTLFESDFCSATVAILRTPLLRVYKGYRLLNLQAA